MVDNFFSLSRRQTLTFQRNGTATTADVEMVLAYRAVSRRTTPVYCASAIQRGAAFARGLIRACLKWSADDNAVMNPFHRRLPPQPMAIARPLVVKMVGRMGAFPSTGPQCGH